MSIHISEIKENDKELIFEISELHKKAFPTFFLTQLGSTFLKTLYYGYLEDSNSGIIIAEKNGKLMGFIAYSNNYPQFYKGLMKKHIIKFAICSVGAAIRHPSFIRRLLGAFKKSESVVKDEAYVELASICVDPSEKGNGIGSLLIEYLKSIVDFSVYKYINLETDAYDNEVANRFYIKNGFLLSRQFSTAEGRKMNEYRFKPKGR